MSCVEAKADTGEWCGLLAVNKEAGYTSHDVVAKLRGILGMKRIGHTGTLDPEAEGVLLVALGKCTRMIEYLENDTKEYEAVLRLGVETDTQDMTGQILAAHPVEASSEAVMAAAASFLGEQMQVPPMYSARKVNGKKLYELAREGKTVEREARPVFFERIAVQEVSLPLVRLSVRCSKGTYIRTLCHDIGQKLGCGGAMEYLCRTRVGDFSLEDSCRLDEIERAQEEGTLDRRVIGVERVFEAYPAFRCPESLDILLRNGNPIQGEPSVYGDSTPHGKALVRMYTSDGAFRGLYEWQEEKQRYFPVKML